MARKRIGALCMYAFILLGVAISLFPFYWLFVMSTRTSAEFFRFPPVMIPGLNLGDNFASLLTVIDFTRCPRSCPPSPSLSGFTPLSTACST